MKKILILNWRDPKHPNAGGAEQATLIHAKAWQKAGFDITWFSSKANLLPEEELVNDIRIIRKGHYVFGVQFQAFLHLLNNKYDLVVDQIHGLPFFTPLYLWDTPKLAYIHELTKEVVWHNPYPFPFNKIVGMGASIFEPLIFRIVYRSTQFMTVSKSTKDELKKWGVKKIEVIHNGVTILEDIKKYKKNTKITLLYLGALARDKGIEDAVEVFDFLAKRHKDWNFWVAGKADEHYLDFLKKHKRIKYFGFVNEKKKFELLSKAHVLVNPSIREGWGLVNIEANYVGTPVVGYKVTGMVDSVKNNITGLLVRHDKDIFACTIEKMLSNEKAYDNLCKNAISFSKNFNWEKSTKMSLVLISKLIM